MEEGDAVFCVSFMLGGTGLTLSKKKTSEILGQPDLEPP